MAVTAPAALVGVIRPVVVKAEVPDTEVTVGRPAPGAVGLVAPPGTAEVGTKTMTPVTAGPVEMPAALVGVIRPVVVKAEVPDTDVIVGRTADGPAGLAPLGVGDSAPEVGTYTITAVYGAAVAMPAAFVGMIRPVVV